MIPRTGSIAKHEPCISSTSPSVCYAALGRFHASGYLALRNTCCTIADGVVCLHGIVPS
jgi:hypothetical protein